MQLCDKINDLLIVLGQPPATFTRRILFMSMFNDISCDRKDNKDECLRNAEAVKVFARTFGIGPWSFIGPGSEKKVVFFREHSTRSLGQHIAEANVAGIRRKRTSYLSAQRLHCPERKFKSKGRGKLSIHFAADPDTIDTIHRIILSVNQLSIYGALAAICEEFEDHQDRTEQPVILVGQSIVLGEVKAETPVHDEDHRNDQIIWQQYI